jgi:hypothetical protein
MKALGLSVIASFLALVSIETVAQDIPSCAAVYSSAVRNVEFYTKQNSQKYYVFSQHCEQNGSIRTTSTNVDLSAAYKLISFDFSGTQDDAKSEMQKFCKTFAQDYSSASASSQYKNTVVVDALESFNECRRLETQGVRFAQSVQAPSRLSITAYFNPDTTILTVKQFDELNFSCTTSAASKDGKIIPAASINKEFKPKGSFVLSCARKGKKSSTGTQYERSSVRIDTNWGPYSVVMQPEGLLNFDLASEAKTQNDELSVRVANLTGTLTSEKNRADTYQTKWGNASAEIYGTMLGEGAPLPCGGSVEAWAITTCGGRPKVGPIVTSVRGGNACGYTGFAVACVNK